MRLLNLNIIVMFCIKLLRDKAQYSLSEFDKRVSHVVVRVLLLTFTCLHHREHKVEQCPDGLISLTHLEFKLEFL